MAKWGEGDPRWIVEERPDAVNVNNWHWVEKNADSWSKNKLKELFVGLKIDDERGSCKVTELSETDGNASISNRKGKLIFFYDWQLKGSWQGKLADGQKKIKGKFEIPHIGEENEPEEIDLNITLDKETDEAREVKEIMRIKGLEIMKKQVVKYVTDLKEEYSQGVILPSANAAKVNGKNKENVAKQEINKVVQSAASTSNNVGVRIPTNTVSLKETFKCRAADVYRALTDKEMVKVYAGGDSTVDATVGGRFVLMGGAVVGDFTKLDPDTKVCMRWRMKSWPEEHYSNVTIDLEEKEGETFLSLKQTGVPEHELERTREGWKSNFWERMKQAFGFSARLF